MIQMEDEVGWGGLGVVYVPAERTVVRTAPGKDLPALSVAGIVDAATRNSAHLAIPAVQCRTNVQPPHSAVQYSLVQCCVKLSTIISLHRIA